MAAVSGVASAQNTTNNPTLVARCGLKVMLVLDESQSIHGFGAVGDVRSAATGFVTALEGTGSPVAITAFHSFARQGVPSAGYQEVTPGNVSTFTNWINNVGGGGYNPPTTVSTSNALTNPTSPYGTTNWEDGFEQVERTGGPPDLVVFVTDGDPNTVNAPGRSGAALTGSGRRFISHNEAGFNTAVLPAVSAANAVKTHSRIFGIGVGPDVTGPDHPTSAERLRRVSGDVAGTNPITADYTLVTHFEELRAELVRIVATLCGSSLMITKFVHEPNGEGWKESPGWQFRTTLDPTPGHTWLQPAHAGTHHEATLTTGGHPEPPFEATGGHAAFHWRLHEELKTATVGVTKETLKPGFRFVLATCETHHLDGTITETDSTTEIPGAVLGREEFHTCQVYNVGPAAHLEVVKRLCPSTDPGRFDLLVDGIPVIENVGNCGSTGRLLVGLGTHMVSERVTAAQAHELTLDHYRISTTCVDQTTHQTVAHGRGSAPVSVHLESVTDDVVCTITNRRIGPSPPIEPPGPGEVLKEPRLTISKHMAGTAQVGDRVPIRITVHNAGHGTATNVRVHETPPPGGQIVEVRDHGSLRPDGTVVWDLGNLAPGKTRTVHATMLVTRAGLLLNTVVTDAPNDDPAIDQAPEHVRPAPHPTPPPFTG